MKTKPTTLRRRTTLDVAVAFIYEYRHQIAYGLMVAAALLKSWNPTIDITPVVKTRRTTKR